MRIIECLHTQNDCYKTATKVTPTGIVVHSTGTNNPYIKRYSQPSDNDSKRTELLNVLGVNVYGNSWNRPGVSKAVHYIVGKVADGSVATVKNLPENYACWGCGKGSYGSYNYSPNARIQFEVCEDTLFDREHFEACYKEATELCADICHRYGWGADKVCSHKEAYLKGYASNHSDIDHWLALYGITMDGFRADVQRLIDDLNKPTEPSAPEEPTFEPYSLTMCENPLRLYNENGEAVGLVNEGAVLTALEERDGKVRVDLWIKKQKGEK